MKTKTSFRQLAKSYLSTIQREIELSNIDTTSEIESIKIGLKNGYWHINNKPLTRCSIAKQTLFDQYMRMKFIKSPIAEKSSFKARAKQIKAEHNYIFKMREQDFLQGHPDLSTLTFNRKIA